MDSKVGSLQSLPGGSIMSVLVKRVRLRSSIGDRLTSTTITSEQATLDLVRIGDIPGLLVDGVYFTPAENIIVLDVARFSEELADSCLPEEPVVTIKRRGRPKGSKKQAQSGGSKRVNVSRAA